MSKKGSTHGNKHVKRSFKHNLVKFDLIQADEKLGQLYGCIESALGGGRFSVINQNKEIIVAKIRGNFMKGPKSEIIGLKSWVLIENIFGNYYINNLYSNDDVDKLKKLKLIGDNNGSVNINIDSEENENNEDLNIDDI